MWCVTQMVVSSVSVVLVMIAAMVSYITLKFSLLTKTRLSIVPSMVENVRNPSGAPSLLISPRFVVSVPQKNANGVFRNATCRQTLATLKTELGMVSVCRTYGASV